MKVVPTEIRNRIKQLREQGMSFPKIAREITNSGFKISRQRCADEYKKGDIGREEASTKEDTEGKRIGQITQKVKSNLDESKQVVSDSLQSIIVALDDPLLGNWVKEKCAENGLITNEEYEAWAEAEESRHEKLQQENDTLRQQLTILAGIQPENEELKVRLQKANKEIERLTPIEMAFEKLTILNQDKIDPFLEGHKQGKKEVLEFFATHPNAMIKLCLKANSNNG